jgi:hypothetical protein
MDKRVLEILRLYLNGEMDLDSLEDQVVRLAFKADDQDSQLVYEVLAEIAYVKDKVSDEPTFTDRIGGIVTEAESIGKQPVVG